MTPKLIFSLFAALLFAGCAYTVKPGARPEVVHAEQAAIQVADALNSYIRWADANRAVLGSDALAARDIAAKDGPVYIRELRRVTKIYKSNPTPANGEQMNQRLAALRQLLETVRTYNAK